MKALEGLHKAKPPNKRMQSDAGKAGAADAGRYKARESKQTRIEF